MSVVAFARSDHMSGKRLISLTVNGRAREDAVADHTLLVDYLRDQLGLTGT